MNSIAGQTVTEAALICASLCESLLPKAAAEQQQLNARYTRLQRVRAFPCRLAGSNAKWNRLSEEPDATQ